MSREFQPELYENIPAGYYDTVFARGRGVQWFWHFQRFSAVAASIPAVGNSILDVGCGPGTFLGRFVPGYERRLGIDLAQMQIEYARANYLEAGLWFEAGDIGALQESDEFDVVVSLEVIEHLPDGETEPFLRWIFRLLKPGGTVVLTTPNYRSAWPLIETIVSTIGPVDYRRQHINRFSVRRLAEELERSGFIVRRTGTFFVLAPFLAALSTRLADAVFRREQRIFPNAGAEIIITAEKPAPKCDAGHNRGNFSALASDMNATGST